MGKGDIKTKKGKITKGTFGVRRPKKSNQVQAVTKKTKKKKITKSVVAKPASEKAQKAKPIAKKETKPKAKEKES